MNASEPDYTFRTFFTQTVSPRISEARGMELQSARVGKDKEKLDIVDLHLSVQSVVVGFGPLVKFRTTLASAECSSSAVVVSQNAFTMLMKSARTMVPRGLPYKKLECTTKDRLYNQILKCLETRNLVWNSDLK